MTTADYTAAFVAGARWWAGREGQGFESERAESVASRRLTRADKVSRGSWPDGYAGRAFVSGAKWQEYQASGGVMWTSDQDAANLEAERRYPIEAQP